MKIFLSVLVFIGSMCALILLASYESSDARYDAAQISTSSRAEPIRAEKFIVKGNVNDAINLGLYAKEEIYSSYMYRPYAHPINEEVEKIYRSADLDKNFSLSGGELWAFADTWARIFNYQDNKYALTPSEFYADPTGDCEDFAIWIADLCNYWGRPGYIATVANGASNHAVAFIKVDRAIEGYINFYVADGTYVEEGYYIPVDYNILGGFSGAVKGDWYIYDVMSMNRIYGLNI